MMLSTFCASRLLMLSIWANWNYSTADCGNRKPKRTRFPQSALRRKIEVTLSLFGVYYQVQKPKKIISEQPCPKSRPAYSGKKWEMFEA